MRIWTRRDLVFPSGSHKNMDKKRPTTRQLGQHKSSRDLECILCKHINLQSNFKSKCVTGFKSFFEIFAFCMASKYLKSERSERHANLSSSDDKTGV